MADNIFISYRRDDSGGYAQAVKVLLNGAIGKEHVFMDVQSIFPGVDFVNRLESALVKCDVLLAVIGKEWLTISKNNKRRLDDPEDFVRLEIASGLKRNIRVIPVLVGGAVMPGEAELPDELKPLARRNAVSASHTNFDDDINRLIQFLGAELGINFPENSWPPRPRVPVALWFSTIAYTLVALIVFNTKSSAGYFFLGNAIFLLVGCVLTTLSIVNLWIILVVAGIGQSALAIYCFFQEFDDPVKVAIFNLSIAFIFFVLAWYAAKKKPRRLID